MVLNYDWILENPIDYEYKRYVLLSFLKKLSFNNPNDNFEQKDEVLYHIRNFNHFLEKNEFYKVDSNFSKLAQSSEILQIDMDYLKTIIISLMIDLENYSNKIITERENALINTNFEILNDRPFGKGYIYITKINNPTLEEWEYLQLNKGFIIKEKSIIPKKKNTLKSIIKSKKILNTTSISIEFPDIVDMIVWKNVIRNYVFRILTT